MPLIDHFTLLAPIYDRFIKPKEPEKLWSLADLPTNGPLLDVGGGTGRIAQFMRERVSQIIVSDLSYRMLVEANNKGGLQTVCSHAESLPFPDDFFTRIIMVDALHHVCDQRITVGELWRVLKPNGRLVIEEPDVRKFSVKLIAFAEKILLMRSYFLSPPKIAHLFSHPKAKVHIEQDGVISWVIIEKEL